jgi:hypothetical protein
MRAFAHKVATRLPDIAGQKPDFVGAFEAVRGLHEADRAEFLQENEEISSAYEAYLAAREEAQATLAKITRAGAAPASRDNVALGLQQRLGDPASRAAIEMNRAEIAKTVSREGALGVQSAGAATAQARAEQAGYNAGLNMFEQAAVTGASETARTMRASGGQTTFLSGIGVMAGGQLSGDVNQFGFWRWVGQIIGQSFADEVSKNNLLPAGNTSGVGRGVSAAAQAPLN